MRRALSVAALVHVATGATGVAAELRLSGSIVAHDPPAVQITARNAGDAPARDVTPTVLFEHRSYDGASVPLGAGEQREWLVTLSPPPSAGTFPVTARIAWRDATDTRHMVPLVLPFSTADAPPSTVELAWTLEPAAPVAHARLSLENRGTQPLAGRVAIILPGELTTEPESQPVAVAANGSTRVPIAIESRGAEARTYPVYAVFTYTESGRGHAVVASAELAVVSEQRGSRAPLAVGLAALAVAIGLLAVALRRSRRSRAAA